MKNFSLILIIFYWLILGSCKVGQHASQSGEMKGNANTQAVSNVETPTNTLTLLDYLRRVPGIQISGPRNDPVITIRNTVSGGMGETSPLFVIDNRPVGNNYSSVASMIDVNDIKSVTILKDVSSTSEYGLQGANGVIVINTKKSTDE